MQSSEAVACLSHSSDLMTEPSGEQQEDTLYGDKNQTGGPVGSLVPRESGSQKSTSHSKQSLSADLSLSLEVSGHTKSLTAAQEAKVWEEGSSPSTSCSSGLPREWRHPQWDEPSHINDQSRQSTQMPTGQPDPGNSLWRLPCQVVLIYFKVTKLTRTLSMQNIDNCH